MIEPAQELPPGQPFAAAPPEPFSPGAIAIIGMAGRFPGASGLDAFWRCVQRGAGLLETFSDADLDAAGVSAADRADPRFVRRGSPLEGALLFDAAFFGIPPREAELLDPQHRIFLECAWQAMEHAGYGPGTPAGVVGVYASASMNTYLLAHVMRDKALVASAGGFQLMLGNDKDFLATRVSYKLDLRGPSMAVQTACSSSLVAVEAACRALQRGACDMALAGGVSLGFPERAGYLFQEGMIHSPDGHCRPFDRDSAGTRPGSGAGIVVLKRLDGALADGDTIHAVLRGIAVNNDGAGKIGYTAPSIDGQAEVIAMAQALAGVEPGSITYAEAHGTATPLGDPIEIAALTRVFGQADAAPGFCRLGSVKASIGHLDVAAGVAGLIKTVLALTHREIPPLANFTAPNPALRLEGGPFAASADGMPWDSAGPRRACVSSFGIGGTNAHAVLEEAPSPPLRASHAARPELLLVSAKTAAALERATALLAEHLETHPGQPLGDIAWTLQAGRQAFSHRRFLVAESHAEAAEALRQPGKPKVMSALHEGGVRTVAFLFSGQGSQHAGMGAALYRSEPAYREAIDHCAGLFALSLGLDIRDTMFAGAMSGDGGAALLRTDLAQPALFCAHYALAQLWRRRGIEPQCMLGHSIGEYAACVLAGVMTLADATRVVAARGRLMAAMPAGGMAAVHAAASDLAGHLAPGIEIAAFNAPRLCTIAGPSAALAATLARLEEGGIAASLLPTSHAFHTKSMADALAPFAAILSEVALSPPKIPYVSSLTGTWITAEQAISPDYYAAHLRHAVRFAEGMRTLAADPALFFLEIGPSQSLSALARANLAPARAGLVAASLAPPRAAQEAERALLEATGRLWLAGAPLDARGMAPNPGDRRRVPLPTYPFERQYYCAASARAGQSPAQPPAPEPSAEARGLRCYAPVWMRDDGNPALRLQGVWLVLGQEGTLARTVLAALARAGAMPVMAHPGQSVTTALNGVMPAGAILLAGLEGADGRALYDAVVAFGAALETLAPPAANVAQRQALPQVIVGTIGAQSVLDERVASPLAALPLGPVLGLAAEMKGLPIRAVDLAWDLPGSLAALLVREAASGFAGPEIAWRGGRRWLRRFDPVEPEAGTMAPRHGGNILITGGLGGIGLALAVRLARDTKARLLLTGRRALPPRAQWHDPLLPAWARTAVRAIHDIEAAGGAAITAQADAANAAEMAAAIANATARWGKLHGVIHAAGNPGSGKLALLQEAGDLAATLVPKLGGLSVLTDLLGEAELDFVALMSSVNAVIPAAGASDYAAANVALDSFAEGGAHPAGWRHVVAIDWGAWSEIGMAANLAVPDALRASREAMLRTAIPTEAAVSMFFRVLGSGRRRVVVTSHDLHSALATSAPAASDAMAAPAEQTPGRMRPALAGGYEQLASETEQILAGIWTELIGVANIGATDDFFELGGHSLLATRVLSRIGQALDVRLTLRAFFDGPTIRQLGDRIDAARAMAKASEAGASAEREEFLL